MFYLDLFRALEQEKVRYLLVGGLALNVHGVERATMDVDLMLGLDAENLQAFLRVAERLKLLPVLPVPLADFADPEKRQNWIREKHLLAFALRSPDAAAPTLDILVQPKVEFSAAWDRRIEKKLPETTLCLATIDDLIALKTDTGRQSDASDVEALLRLKTLKLD